MTTAVMWPPWCPIVSRSAGDLPDVPARIPEARRADAPGAVDGPVQELDAERTEALAHLVDVVDAEGELEARAVVRAADRGRRDQLGRLIDLQEVDHRPPEEEDG